MALDANFLLDVLGLVGGGRGDALNNLTPHLLGFLAWGGLCVYQLRISKTVHGSSDNLLLTAFICACAHEAADFIAQAALILDTAVDFFEHGLWPPFELLLCALSRVLLAAAFIQLLFRQRKVTLDFMLVSLAIAVIIYGYTTYQWRLSLLTDPNAAFEQQRYAWIMHGAMLVAMITAMIKCMTSLRSIRWPVISALVMLQLESVFSIAAYQSSLSLTSVIDPIAGCFALASIALFGYATLTFHVNTEKRIKQGLQNSERLESLGLLSSGIAHDFNNHLQIILGYVELAKLQSNSTSENHQSLQRIEEAAERAGSLVNQLLAFSLGQAPKFENVDLNETVTKLTPLLTRLLGSEIKLVHELDLNIKLIKADTQMIEQIILNLVANARDAIEHAGTITVRSRALTKQDKSRYSGETGYDRTQLVVIDTGEGMEEKTINRAFEPFFTTKPIGKGTGLGLATVYSAVQKHNGKIHVFSRPGAYTRVYIEFPAVEIDERDVDRSERSTAGKASGQTILLAEDEISIRELASTLLEAAGYRVIVASNGQHAINIINTYKGHIDLCLFDVAMPVLNGYQTYDRIRKTRPEIGVLFITGNTARVEQFRSEHPHLQKPFTQKTLLDKLSLALELSTISPPGSSTKDNTA